MEDYKESLHNIIVSAYLATQDIPEDILEVAYQFEDYVNSVDIPAVVKALKLNLTDSEQKEVKNNIINNIRQFYITEGAKYLKN